MISRKLGILACVCAFALLTGAVCLPQPPTQTGTVKVLIGDAAYPFDFISEVIVTVTRVDIRQGEVSETDGGDSEGTSDNDFITIFDNPSGTAFNLLNLQNGLTDVVAQSSVPVGAYSQLRLVLSGGRVTLTNNETFDLTVPSGDASGMIFDIASQVNENAVTELLIDFNVSEAIEVTPSTPVSNIDDIQGFNFHSPLQDAIRVVEVNDTGQISGRVIADGTELPIASALVTAYVSLTDVKIGTTLTGPDGRYLLIGLLPDTYYLTFAATGYQEDMRANDILVIAGETTADVNISMVGEAVSP